MQFTGLNLSKILILVMMRITTFSMHFILLIREHDSKRSLLSTCEQCYCFYPVYLSKNQVNQLVQADFQARNTVFHGGKNMHEFFD